MKPFLDWKHTKQVYIGAASGAKSKNAAAERGNQYHRRVYKLLEMNARLAGPDSGWELMVEPWFRAVKDNTRWTARSPDAVLLNQERQLALVVEVKLNWKDGKDQKLIEEYLPIVKHAFRLEAVRPLLITRNTRGLAHEPLLGLGQMWSALNWSAGLPTPVLLVP